MSLATLEITPLGSSSAVVFKNIQLDNYEQTPLYTEDTITVYGLEVNVSGTCTIIVDDAYATLQAQIQQTAGRIHGFSVKNGSASIVNNTSEYDDIGGPFFKMKVTQVIGASTALLTWEIRSVISIRSTGASGKTAVAHRWRQTMTLDGAGKATRQIFGSLKVGRGGSGVAQTRATNESYIDIEAWTDLFRDAIIPGVPGYGWRRESQEFALDDIGTTMSYVITDKQHLHDLPDGVRVGDMECRYERSLADKGIGVITFSCDLEGDLGLDQSGGNRTLIDAAVALSTTRINASYKNVIIQRMSVTEKNMLSSYAIRFELTAHLLSETQGSTSIVALASIVGQKFRVVRLQDRTIPAYGPYARSGGQEEPTDGYINYSMIPHWYANTLSGQVATSPTLMPRANLLSFAGNNATGTITVMSYASSSVAANESFVGAFQTVQQQGLPDASNFQTSIFSALATTHVKYDSGIVRIPVMLLDSPDRVVQTKKPTVIVTEHIEIVRMNQAPPKVQRPQPAYFVIQGEEWSVSAGKMDAQGNRAFTGIYTRTLIGRDQGITGDEVNLSGFYTATYTEDSRTISLRAWKAPAELLIAPIIPLLTDASQQSTEDVFLQLVSPTDERQVYSVPPEVWSGD